MNFSRHDLIALVSFSEKPCVSMLMPIHPGPPESKQDAIRFKNLLAEAEKRLLKTGLRRAAAREILAPAVKLREDTRFWIEHSAHGLALFLAPGFHRRFRTPHSLEELLVVGDGFHVKPLVQLFLHDGRFFILALSKSAVRLYQGTRAGLSSLPLPRDCPGAMEEALAGTEIEKSLQHHSAPAGKRPGTEFGVIHGQGRPKDSQEKFIEEYFRKVADALRPILGPERTPLILAAVEYLQPVFREVYSDPYLLEDGISGSPENMSEKELLDAALPIVAPWFRRNFEMAAKRFGGLIASGRTANDLEAVLAAAAQGKIDTLFVARGRRIWGRCDPEKGDLALSDQAGPGDIDLLNHALEQTLLHGGEAFVVERESIPGETGKAEPSPIAAILRWGRLQEADPGDLAEKP